LKNRAENYARRNLRRTIPAIPARPVESSIRLPGSGVASGDVWCHTVQLPFLWLRVPCLSPDKVKRVVLSGLPDIPFPASGPATCAFTFSEDDRLKTASIMGAASVVFIDAWPKEVWEPLYMPGPEWRYVMLAEAESAEASVESDSVTTSDNRS
jgi:hypothetical protein